MAYDQGKDNVITFKLTDEELADLDSVRGLPDGRIASRSAVVRQALKEYVEAVRGQAAPEPEEKFYWSPSTGSFIEYVDGSTRPFDGKTEKWDGKRAVPKTSKTDADTAPSPDPDGSYSRGYRGESGGMAQPAERPDFPRDESGWDTPID